MEVGRPEWATGTLDGGLLLVRFDPTGAIPAGTIEAEFAYINTVPTPSITTRASDAADGDKFLAHHAQDQTSGTMSSTTPATIVDVVSYEGLVPGTAYIARGELVIRDDACDSPCPTPPATGETAFVPDTADGSVEVRIEVPDDMARGLAGGVVAVVFERIVVSTSGRVVAEHADLDDLDQAVYFPALTSNLQLDTSAPRSGLDGREGESGDAIVDVVRYAGLASGERYRMEMTLHERLADGTCVPTAVRASVEFAPTEAAGMVEVRGAELPGPGVFVAFEHLLTIDSPTGDSLIAAHDDCDDLAQTLRVAPPAVDAPTTSTAPTSTPPPTIPPPSTPPTTTAAPTTTTLPTPIVTPPGPGSLPRTGGDGARDITIAAFAMLMIGAGLLLLARTARRA